MLLYSCYCFVRSLNHFTRLNQMKYESGAVVVHSGINKVDRLKTQVLLSLFSSVNYSLPTLSFRSTIIVIIVSLRTITIENRKKEF
jgi:hypothetical protein